MTIEVEYLSEPKLQFGSYFEHEDSKTGLAEFGPFGKAVPGLHPSEIKLGFVGTRETVSGAKEWVEECGSPIESVNAKVIPGKVATMADTGLFQPAGQPPAPTAPSFTRLMKILNRDFIGFSQDSQFKCCFQTNPRWNGFSNRWRSSGCWTSPTSRSGSQRSSGCSKTRSGAWPKRSRPQTSSSWP